MQDILANAVENGYESIVRFIINQDEHKNVNHNDLLLVAIRKGYDNIVKLLIKKDECWSVYYRADSDHELIVRSLVKNGANVCAGRNRPLTMAVYKGHEDIVKFLVENGANPNNGLGEPLICAAGNGHESILRYLIENGAIDGVKDALLSAVNNNDESMVKYIIKEFPWICHERVGDLALDLALMSYMSIARLLIENGAGSRE